MEIDLKKIKANYEKFDDWKLEQLATDDPLSLRPEVLKILKDEIQKRGLNKGLIASIDKLTREIYEDEFDEFCEMVRNHPCPKCKSNFSKLKATVIGTVNSFILFTNYDKRLRLGCKDCLDKEHNISMLKSGLLGWWGIPWGPIRTIQSFIFNSNQKRAYHQNQISPTMAAFVIENVGSLEVAKVDPNELTNLILHTNNQ